MKLSWCGPLRSKTIRVIAPVAILGLILSACSPGTAATLAAIFGGQPLATPTGPPIGPRVSTDFVKFRIVCINTEGVCQGFLSAAATNPTNDVAAGGFGRFTSAHLISANFGSAGTSNSGFLQLNGKDCFANPCPEGGQVGLGGNATLYLPSGKMLVTYFLRGFDNDSPTGAQTKPDTFLLQICTVPFTATSCGGVLYNETFTCTDPSPTQSCLEVNVRARNAGT